MKKTACFLSGAVLALVLLLTAVLIPALSTQRFQAALVNTVDQQALGVSEGDLSAFAEETMRYLRSEKDSFSVWAVSISGYSGALSLPSSSFVAKCLRR